MSRGERINSGAGDGEEKKKKQIWNIVRREEKCRQGYLWLPTSSLGQSGRECNEVKENPRSLITLSSHSGCC